MKSFKELEALRKELEAKENARRKFAESACSNVLITPNTRHVSLPMETPNKIIVVFIDDGCNPAFRAGEVHHYPSKTVWYDLSSSGRLINPKTFPACDSFGIRRMRECADASASERVYAKRR